MKIITKTKKIKITKNQQPKTRKNQKKLNFLQKELVKIYPSTLVLIKSRNSDYYESKINFTNLTDDYILVKSYNNQINLYTAKPSTTFIKPKETTNILTTHNEANIKETIRIINTDNCNTNHIIIQAETIILYL